MNVEGVGGGPFLQLPKLPGPRYLVGTVPAALADRWPCIGPLQ